MVRRIVSFVVAMIAVLIILILTLGKADGKEIIKPQIINTDIEGVTEPAKDAVADIAYKKYLEYLEAKRKEEEQRRKEAEAAAKVQSSTVNTDSGAYVSPSDFRWMGTCHYNGWKWTYYSQRVLPGGGLSIPGRHVDSDGFVCDENGYIVLASTIAQDKKDGAVYWTPFGRWGKVYDFCDGVSEPTLDCYVNW